MATKTIETKCDDLTGAPGAETLRFTHQGKEYAIDLTPEGRERFQEIMGKVEMLLSVYVEKGREVTLASVMPKDHKEYMRQLRAWAEENGEEVKERGRVRADVKERFNQYLLDNA